MPKKKRPLSEEEADARVPPGNKQASSDSALGSDSIVKINEALLKSREDRVNEILANIPASLLKDFDRLYEPIPVVDAKCGWSSVMPKSCKIIIKCTASSVSVMSLDDVNDVFMVFADDEFCRIFLYNQCSFSSFPLSRLVPRDTLHQLKVFKNALLRGKSVMEFVAMNRTDGVLLNTHVTLTSINGSSKMLSDKLNLIEKVTSGQDCTPIECWGVLTIRNSRCISEAKYSGAGVFGMREILDSRDLFGGSHDVRGVIPSEEQVTDAV
jgi:hypothetical protein